MPIEQSKTGLCVSVLFIDRRCGLEFIVKPGITGMAQINLPPDTDLRSVERKQILDLYHIDNADFWLDKRMVLLTAFRVLSISNDRLTRLMGLDRKYLVQHLPAETTGSTSTPLSTLMAETTAKRSLDQDSQPTEDELEARDFHAGWDGGVVISISGSTRGDLSPESVGRRQRIRWRESHTIA